MAKPRVFVSSTFYDLKHIRSSLEGFIESLGFEPILSEKGHIAYSHDQPLDESCYREISGADIFVMLIGGRYGSEKSGGEAPRDTGFMARYDSVTKQELKTAIGKDIPIYIFIEKPVYADYENYLQNKDNDSVRYAHVDSVNTLILIDEVLRMPRNNPVQQFEKYGEIEEWLRLQWAGTFRELLQKESSQKQLSSLQAQVDALSAINQTLRSYMEQIITKLDPERSEEIIKTADSQLREARLVSFLSHADPFEHMIEAHELDPAQALRIIQEESTFRGIRKKLHGMLDHPCLGAELRASHIEALNELRDMMDLPKFVITDDDHTDDMSDDYYFKRLITRRGKLKSQQDKSSGRDKSRS